MWRNVMTFVMTGAWILSELRRDLDKVLSKRENEGDGKMERTKDKIKTAVDECVNLRNLWFILKFVERVRDNERKQ